MFNSTDSLTLELITGLSDDDARKTFNDLGERYYGTDVFRPKFAGALGITTRTIHVWRTETRPPPWAILLLDAWLTIRDLTNSQEQIGKAFKLVQGFATSKPAV